MRFCPELRHVLAAAFLLCAGCTGLLCLVLTPFGMFPDEQLHIVRAEGLRYGELFGIKPPPGFPPTGMSQGATANIAVLEILVSLEPVTLFPARPGQKTALAKAAAENWKGVSYWPTQMDGYAPIFYAPPALALYLAEAWRLRPLAALYAGRAAMLASFLVLGASALLLARAGLPLLFMVLTLPTTVNLAASYNQDALLTASCALAAALLTRPGFRAWICGLAALLCVVCAKLPYVPLLAIFAQPGAPGWWRRLAWLLAGSVLPGLWLLHMLQFGFMVYQHAPYHPGPLWPGARGIWLTDVQPRYNIFVLAAHPALLLLLPLRSFAWLWPHIWPLVLGMVGCDHGLLPRLEYFALIFVFLSALAGTIAGPRISLTQALLAALALFATFIALYLSLYITWDNAGQDKIIGVQSRYFLLFLPFLLFLLPVLAPLPGARRLAALPQAWFAAPAMALAAINSIALPVYVFHLYHAVAP